MTAGDQAGASTEAPAGRRVAPPRRTPWWAGALAILLALLVVGGLNLLRPDPDDPKLVSRAAMGEWAEVGDHRVRVVDVQVSQAGVDYVGDEVKIPGAVVVMATLESEALVEQSYLVNMVTLVSGGRSYEARSDLSIFPDAEPGFISHGELMFVVPANRADRGSIEFAESFGLYTGIQRQAVRVGWQNPEQIPAAVATDGKVRPV